MFSDKSKGYLAILISTFLYGWFGIFVKMIGVSIPIYYQSLTRNIVVAVILILFILISKQGFRIRTRSDLFKILARSVFGFINITTALISFEKLSIGFAYILFFTGLLTGSFIIGSAFNKERISKIKIVSLGLTLLGVIVTYAYRAQISGEFFFIVLAIVSGVAVAFWNVLSQYINKNISATALNCYDAILISSLSLASSLLVGEVWNMPTISLEWLANLGLIVTFLFAGILIPYGFRKVEVQLGSILMPLEIVFGVILGYIFLHESMSISLLIGCGMIIVASILPYVVDLRGSRRIRRQ